MRATRRTVARVDTRDGERLARHGHAGRLRPGRGLDLGGGKRSCDRRLQVDLRRQPLRTVGVVRRVLPLALLALAVAHAGSAAPAQRAGSLRAFVSVEGGGALAVVDVASRRVVRRIPVAARPHNVDVTGDGRVVVVTSPPAGTVTVVDGRRLRVLRAIRGLRSPHDAKLTNDGRYAYVTEEGARTVAVVDTTRGRVVSRLGVGAPPHDLAVGDVVWVTLDRSSRVAVFGCRGPEPSCGVRPGRPYLLGRPSARAPAHDVDRFADTADAWVTYWRSPSVGAFTAATRLRLRRGVVPGAMHLAADHVSGRRLWVVGETGDAAIVATPGGRVLRRIRLGRPLHHVAVAPVRDLVGVAAEGPPALLLLTRTTGRLLGEVRAGAAVHDVAFALTR